MPNGTYGGVRGRKTKVGRKLLRFPPTRLYKSVCLAIAMARYLSKDSYMELLLLYSGTISFIIDTVFMLSNW